MYSICGDYRDKTAEALRPAIVRLECGLNALVVEHPELHSAVLYLRPSLESITVAGFATIDDIIRIFHKTPRMPDLPSLEANGIRVVVPPHAGSDFSLFKDYGYVFESAIDHNMRADAKEIQARPPLSPEQEWEVLEPFVEIAERNGLGISREDLNAAVKEVVDVESAEGKELQKVLEDTLSAAGVTVVERWLVFTDLVYDEDD